MHKGLESENETMPNTNAPDSYIHTSKSSIKHIIMHFEVERPPVFIITIFVKFSQKRVQTWVTTHTEYNSFIIIFSISSERSLAN